MLTRAKKVLLSQESNGSNLTKRLLMDSGPISGNFSLTYRYNTLLVDD